MDKNTGIGLALIALIIIGFSYMNRPTEEELEAQRQYRDSIAMVQKTQFEQQVQQKEAELLANMPQAEGKDSLSQQKVQDAYGAFAPAAVGQEEFYVIENDLLKLTLSNKGGRIYAAELKNYRTHDSLPIILFEGSESTFGTTLVTNSNRILNTKDLFFVPVDAKPVQDAAGNQTFTLRLRTEGDAYMDFIYTLPVDDYMVKYDIKSHAMNTALTSGFTYLDFEWASKIRQQEKGRKFEEKYATLQYKFVGDDIENLSETGDDKESPAGDIKWIAFKDQFFSSVLIADNAFTSTTVESRVMDEKSGYIKDYKSIVRVDYDPLGVKDLGFRFYLGPNHYNTLKAYDEDVAKADKLELNKLIPLGWSMIAWINRVAVIPMFDLFSRWFDNFGLIIFLMTVVIKLVIFPFTFKSYISSAKMRVLKPEIDEINSRIPAEKMQERQQAQMNLYRKVGVSPMSGCLPLVFQMPILMAMFWFFPTSIELRQEAFLWASDLSTYDAIITWEGNIPIVSWIFGNHISLFCLLMTVVNIIYTKINMAAQGGGATDQMPMMKWMMYLMPLMFLFIFNNYAAGLSYYYFISLLITIIQTYIFRWSINDEKLLAELHAKRAQNEKSPKKKSGFAARLEKMQREQQAYMKEQAKKNKR